MSLAGTGKETVEICRIGRYRAPSGKEVDIRLDVERAVRGTLLHRPDELEKLAPADRGVRGSPIRFEVTGETTAQAARRRVETEPADRVAALNFASARNPGGGFLGGARAQEEDLARCSALYACQITQPGYYNSNRAHSSLLYTDHIIYSPDVPFFRDERLEFLERPFQLSIITAPAPNAGEVLRLNPNAGPAIRDTLRRRSAGVLHVAAHHGHRVIVLGAWGCGVFRNNPDEVADAFASALAAFEGAFDHIVFAVWERGGDGPNLHAFRKRFLT